MTPNDMFLPPQAIEAEQAVIGGLLLDNQALERIDDLLTPTHFYRHDHRLLFQHLVALLESNQPADIVTLAESMENSGELMNVGGIAYIGALAQNTPSAANIRRYAEIVKRKWQLRALLSLANELQEACLSSSIDDPEKIALNAENEIFNLFKTERISDMTLDQAIQVVMTEVDSRATDGNQFNGLLSGLANLDAITCGFEPGQLIIVAARPSVGKSVFACNVADAAAAAGKSVLFHTLEMSAKEIGMRILAARSGVTLQQMRTGTRENNHWDAMTTARKSISQQKLTIDDRPAVSVHQVRAKAKRVRRNCGLDLIVVDYLGLMTGKGDNRTQEIGSISRGLKNLAKELQIPIIALAQLNRGVESRQDKRPMMSDLRDSGEVEQDADIIVMLHREEMYNSSDEWTGLAEALVRKNRNGPTGDIYLLFDREISKFRDYNGPRVRGGTKMIGGSVAEKRGFES
ncbi:replicative DNA helicase [Methylovorus sp. SPW-M1]